MVPNWYSRFAACAVTMGPARQALAAGPSLAGMDQQPPRFTVARRALLSCDRARRIYEIGSGWPSKLVATPVRQNRSCAVSNGVWVAQPLWSKSLVVPLSVVVPTLIAIITSLAVTPAFAAAGTDPMLFCKRAVVVGVQVISIAALACLKLIFR